MRHYDHREDRMGQVWLIIIPFFNVLVHLYWVFTWLHDMCEDLSDHTGMDMMPHYNKIRIGTVLMLLGIPLVPIFGIGLPIILIGLVVWSMGLLRISKDMEEHLIEEHSYDYWITRGSMVLGTALVWPLQMTLNAHWRTHGLE